MLMYKNLLASYLLVTYIKVSIIIQIFLYVVYFVNNMIY